jgi:hypothetical protein
VIEEGYSQGETAVMKVLEQIKTTIERSLECDQSQSPSQEMQSAKITTNKWAASTYTIPGTLADGCHYKDGHVMILDGDLVKYIKDEVHNGQNSSMLERPLTIRRVAKDLGWYVGTKRANIKNWGSPGSRIITNCPELSTKQPSEIQDLSPLTLPELKEAGGIG